MKEMKPIFLIGVCSKIGLFFEQRLIAKMRFSIMSST